MILKINDEHDIELLHWIFERELKPPLRIGQQHINGWTDYYNRNDDIIGSMYEGHRKSFDIIKHPFLNDIKYKICQAFGFELKESYDWWLSVKPYLKSWLEDRLNIEIKLLYDY